MRWSGTEEWLVFFPVEVIITLVLLEISSDTSGARGYVPAFDSG